MLSTILNAGLVAVAALALPAFAQSQVYKCGETHLYTDKPCDDAHLVDLNRQPNILQPGPTYVAPPPEPEKNPNPVTIWKNSSRIVSTPPAAPSTIWSDRDARQTSPGAVPAATVGRRDY